MSNTQVKAVGFQLTTGNNITIGDLFKQLRSISGQERKIYGKTTILFTEVSQRYIVGLVLSYKGDKKSVSTMKDANGDLIVQKSQLKSNEHKTEASMFILNPTSSKGIMFQYYGSTTTSGLAVFLRNQHTIVKRRKIKKRKAKIQKKEKLDNDAAGKKAAKHFKGDLNLNVLVRKVDLDTLIARYKDISALEARVGPEFPSAPSLEPVREVSSGASYTFRLDGKYKPGILKDAIISAAKGTQKEFETFRLIGTDLNGEELREFIGDNTEHFFKLDYDEYIAKLPLAKWKNYVTCDAMTQLMEIVKSAHVTFGKPGPVSSWKL